MNPYHGLLFMHGHIADPKLAMSLGRSNATPAQISPSPKPASHWLGRLRWLVEEFVLLGGRPVSRQHLDDIEEPFPPLHPCP